MQIPRGGRLVILYMRYACDYYYHRFAQTYVSGVAISFLTTQLFKLPPFNNKKSKHAKNNIKKILKHKIKNYFQCDNTSKF